MLPRLSLLVEFLMLRTSLELSLIRSRPTLFLKRLARRRLMRLQGVLLTRALACIMPFSCHTCHTRDQSSCQRKCSGRRRRIRLRACVAFSWITSWYERPPAATRGSLAAGCSSCMTALPLGPVVGQAHYISYNLYGPRCVWARMHDRDTTIQGPRMPC
jgi:hypothetical protein